MQITETSAEGLKREFRVTVAANDVEREMNNRLAEIGRSVRLPGFRPGKVPMQILKKRYGTAVRGEVLEHTVNESSSKAMEERGLRPALQPKVEILSFKEGEDLEYKMAVELLPEIPPVQFDEIALERLRPEIDEAEVEKALERMARSQRKSEPVDRAAASGDIVVIDFVGTLDGKEFDGGKANDFHLEIGAGRFVPGFEDQLVGSKAGENRTVAVTFPADYGVQDLAGKAAEFAVTVKEVREPKPVAIDDELAKTFALDTLDELKDSIRKQLEREYGTLARQRLKRALLDQLAEKHDFPVPAGMADLEFETIWKQFEEARTANQEGADEDAGKSEDELKAEYRGIAERRVRLGLLLSEIGRTNAITVSAEEVNRALGEEARRHPGHERQVIEFFRNNPAALANLRAPIFEDKVVDFIVEMAKVSERAVPVAELLAPEDADAKEKAPAVGA